MANRKKEVYKPKPMTEGKRNLIQGLLQEYDIQSAEDIQDGIIDLWNNDDFNQLTDEQRTLYMADSIHPTKAGYLEWWLPTMETFIIEYLGKETD